MSDFADRITLELGVLIGLPVTDCWRAADMQIFEFGSQEPFINRKGKTAYAARFRVHVQCPWRVVALDRILFARHDLFEPADPAIDRSSFDYDKHSSSLLDVKQRAWFAEHRNKPLMVVVATGDQYGGCRIAFEGGFALECVPFHTGPDHEHWRLLDGESPRPHFVVTTDGIE